MSASTSPGRPWPSIPELRAAGQPPSIRGRRSAEHWTADVYLRRFSPYLTRVLLWLGLSANAVTWLMILSGWSIGVATLVGGLGGAVAAVLLANLQMLLDCCDGEVARWRATSSPAGVFLDKLGHYTTESFLPLALGVRAASGFPVAGEAFWWTTLGGLLAVLILLNKSLNDSVHVARAFAGLDRLADSSAAVEPRSGLLRRARQVARFVPFHRLYHSVELSMLILAAAVVDQVRGDLEGTRMLLTVLVVAAVFTTVGHVVAILSSSRLRGA